MNSSTTLETETTVSPTEVWVNVKKNILKPFLVKVIIILAVPKILYFPKYGPKSFFLINPYICLHLEQLSNLFQGSTVQPNDLAAKGVGVPGQHEDLLLRPGA